MKSRNSHRLGLWATAALMLLCLSANSMAAEEYVDFEQFPGGAYFTEVQPPLTVGNATFSGGQVLSGASFMPANRTKVYGTAHFCAGCASEIQIDFQEPVSELKLQIFNGMTTTISYAVTADTGEQHLHTLSSNARGGFASINFSSKKISSVSIRGGSSSGFDFFVDNLVYTVGGEQFRINFSAFIPANNVAGGPTEFCLKPSLFPRRELYYKGDERWHDPLSEKFRVRELLTVITDSSEDSDGLKDGSKQLLVSQSRSYASDAVEDGVLSASDEDGISRDCVLFHDAATAPPDNMSVTVRRSGPKAVKIEMKGGPPNPLSTLAKLLGTLDWHFFITIDSTSGTPVWTLSGAHDGFPAYEIYIDDMPIYIFSPGVPPYSVRQISALSGGLDIKIPQRSGSL